MRTVFALLVVVSWPSLAVAWDALPNDASPEAVQEVLSGRRTVANAAWWGFDPDDATDALQAAIKSGARTVIVPNLSREWRVRPIELASDQELVLEEGVVIAAKRGAYQGKGDSVFNAANLSNLSIRGYGATIRMQKEDYIVGTVLANLGWNRWYGPYDKAEWRMCLRIRGCDNVEVLGLTLRDSGGDGIYIDGGKKSPASSNIRLQDVVCENNYRQGISIISVNGLLVENSEFNNTWGTPPSSGVDIEPDGAEQQLQNIVFRNCRFLDNYGDGIELHLPHQRVSSAEISILFDRCHVSTSRGTGIRISKITDDGPAGLIEFRDCVVDGSEGYGIKVQDKSASRARVRFVRCTVRAAARDREYHAPWAPLWLQLRAEKSKLPGGIDFIDCLVEDDRDRPFLSTDGAASPNEFVDITGDITVRNPNGVYTDRPLDGGGVTLQIHTE
ncbi:MAG: right-handed parallel beta-helix repeat-containing protein [Planctomycetaceae bacterium]|nr:right-handed parallel beta-helix repeat-containing protein [Planctomycetaceae bacterium]